MFRNLVQLYAMLICLISTIGIMFMFPSTILSIIDLNYTESRYYSNLMQYESDQNFINSYKPLNDDISNKTKSEITQIRMTKRSEYIMSKKSDALDKIISNSIWIMSFAFFFTIHWALYQKSKKNEG